MLPLRPPGTTAVICLLAAATWAGAEPLEPPPSPEALLRNAAAPLASRWLSPASIQKLADPEVTCLNLFITLDWIAEKVHEMYDKVRHSAHMWQDLLIEAAFDRLSHPHVFFRSSGFRALLQPAIDMQRLCQYSADFVSTLSLLHGERCWFPKLRDALALMVAAVADVSGGVHRIQLATIYKSLLSFWEDSADVLRHVEPVWDVIQSSAKCADAWADARLRLDYLSKPESNVGDEDIGGESAWQDESGAFSDMNYIQRQLTNSWHLDHGLLASLLRLWRPPASWQADDACHTSIADFGAGSGHYCNQLNLTGEFCCQAFDGSPNAARLSDGKVQTLRLDEPFDLGRKFDWVICLEVAEHLPREAEKVLLENIRRHAVRGIVLSWSEDAHAAHPNARPWQEVRRTIEAEGFRLEAEATAQLRPQVEWLRDAVHIFTLL